MPYFLASSVDSRISSTVIFLSICVEDASASRYSTPRLRPLAAGEAHLAQRSSSSSRSTRVSQLQKNPSLRSRMPRHSSRTRFLFVVKVSSLIWIIFTGRRVTTLLQRVEHVADRLAAEAAAPGRLGAAERARPGAAARRHQDVRVEVVVRATRARRGRRSTSRSGPASRSVRSSRYDRAGDARVDCARLETLDELEERARRSRRAHTVSISG